MRHATRRAVVALAVLGCVGALGDSALLAQQSERTAASATPAGVRSAKLADGTPILTDASGMTLYTFLKDMPGQSNCNDGCAVQWPPVAASGAPPSADWSVVTRTDGSMQWAYRGKPLYRWIKDAKPGDMTGEGVANGAWKIAAVDRPPDFVKVHLAHLTTTFNDTPKQQGLLATALAEAKIAAAHAELAAKAGTPDQMKMHAGHVLHAIDPAVERTGPGLGFGVRRAASAMVEHVQLAAKAINASPAVLTIASRVLASCNNTVKRSDEIVDVAKRIQAAGTKADAAADLALLTRLARELTSGLDVNRDGVVGWQTGEGGLEQAQAQIQSMVKSGT